LPGLEPEYDREGHRYRQPGTERSSTKSPRRDAAPYQYAQRLAGTERLSGRASEPSDPAGELGKLGGREDTTASYAGFETALGTQIIAALHDPACERRPTGDQSVMGEIDVALLGPGIPGA